MDLRIIYAILLSILPISELRGGLIYASLNNLNPITSFLACTIANILVIFFVFFFLDNIHHLFLRDRIYKKFFDGYVKIIQGKVDKFEKKYSAIGFLALALFVAIPLPATGAWSGVLISWLLDLDRKKSILAIASGVLIAGILVLLGTLGVLGLFNVLN
ncbi:MAG: small multi-drug export protein [Candidatus Nanoarchaeia archaeon]|nr:small multi-drug export protein [Candidatus Nanoarchaeia archaeon]